MSFLRDEEIYSPIGAQPGRAPTHRLNEFPAGYSFAGCSPAEPASASPTGFSLGLGVRRDNDLAANRDVSLFRLSQTRGPLHGRPARSVPSMGRI
jgi:hypothetical protein